MRGRGRKIGVESVVEKDGANMKVGRKICVRKGGGIGGKNEKRKMDGEVDKGRQTED